MKRTIYMIIPIFCFLFVFGFMPFPAAGAQVGPRLTSALAAAAPNETIPVIIRMAEQLDLSLFSRLPKKERRRQLMKELRASSGRSQRELRQLLNQVGIRKVKDLWHINALALDADPGLIAAIADRPEVASVSLDGLVALPIAQPAAVAPPEWNLAAIGVFDLWNLLLPGSPGDGMVVATIDTGVAEHPALQNWRAGPYDWYDPTAPDNMDDTPSDSAGHGTAVMGIITGSDANGHAIGVAPAATWIAANPFAGPSPTYSSLHSSFAWLLNPDGDPQTDDAPDVVNNSWALDAANSCSLEFQTDINLLKSAGIAVVFASGNSGPVQMTSQSPGNNPNVLAVGATDQQRQVAVFSSRGNSTCDGGVFPELVAPGVEILSTFWNETDGPVYTPVSGTSFSTPHIAGIMVLLIQAFPEVTVRELELSLLYSADDLGPPGPDSDYGYGLVNAVRAHHFLAGKPILRSPLNGAVDVSLPVVLNWAQRYDLPTSLLIAQTPDFSQSTPIVVSSIAEAEGRIALLAGCGLSALAFFLRRRGPGFSQVLFILMTSVILLSCGDEGGDDSVAAPAEAGISYTVSDLSPATTYYWQVQTVDADGVVTVSAISSFMTE